MTRLFSFRRLAPLFITLVLFAAPSTQAQGGNTERLRALAREFNALNTQIRDNEIPRAEAKERFRGMIQALSREYRAAGGVEYPEKSWCFPLKRYGYRAIGGVRGNGYQFGGYDYFAGNRHTGHPSHDIFIHDKRQEGLDDRTGEPVQVLSMTGGVVVAEEKEWQPGSRLRGGKYLWIFDPATESLVYYAHNRALHVEVGDLVRPGDAIAEVGRTGLNAHKRRSPTHLHLTLLSVAGGLPVARNPYRALSTGRLTD
ncbi:M23 family metallopeptidase [Geomonas nitrogeniifigens]|uniref:M23 family metallopeptidase n=1 Tax=Geomonas diazotrophica TaxID=2843197 RepID=A0ABX8JJK8_9BACT|nr:M23 family metallopeptidase [Geomonas nitrogeniifigens]QWV98478.1 M23 family metallopeptidase [Geomonas nitrogeniifigens]